MSLDNLKSRIQSTKKQAKPSEYETWRASVLSKYPEVFFPTLSAKKKKILKAIVQRLHQDTSHTWEDLSLWIVDNWSELESHTTVKEFSKAKYPELSVVLVHYDKLINAYTTARSRTMTKPKEQQKKRLDFSFLNERKIN